MSLIEVEKLSYTYAGTATPALREVNLKVEKGEFILIMGATGSGKSTLCRCINGLIPSHYAGGRLEGSVRVAGLETSRHAVSEIAARVGYVFQNPENQLFALTVEKNVSFGLENIGLNPDEIGRRVEWALKSVGMLELRKRAPYDLSGGQQQRVAIAAALALKPELLIMDEPTSYLDPVASRDVITLAGELNRTLGMTILLVEHRVEVAAPHATRLLIMKEGRIVRDGDARKILLEDDMAQLGVPVPKTLLLYKSLASGKSRREKAPLDAEETVRYLNKALK